MSDSKKDLRDDQIKSNAEEGQKLMQQALKLAVEIESKAESRPTKLDSLSQEELLARALLHFYKTIGQAAEQASVKARSDKGDQGSNCDYFQGGKFNVGDISD